MADPVYLTINEFPGTGAAAPTVVDFNFAGGYISPAHVKAEIFDPVTYLRTPVTVTDDHFVTASHLSLPVVVPTGSILRVYRDTPKDQPLVDFTNGARIAENNLNLVAQQAVFVAAESADQIEATQVADVLQAVEAAALSAAAAQTDAAASAVSATLSQAAAQDGASISGGFALAAAASATASSTAAAAAAAESFAVRADLASTASGKGPAMVGFKPVGAGAVDTDVAEVLRLIPFANFYAALQAAIDAAIANNLPTVRLPPGDFTLPSTAPLSITSSVILEGAVSASSEMMTRLLCPGSGILIERAAGADNIVGVHIKNLRIDKTGDPKTAGTFGIKAVGANASTSFENVDIRYFEKNWWLRGCIGAQFRNVSGMAGAYGLFTESHSTLSYDCTNCDFYGCKFFNGNDVGVYFGPLTQGINFFGGDVERNTIGVQFANTAPASGAINFYGTWFEANTTHWLFTQKPIPVQFNGCYLYGGASGGTTLWSNGGSGTITAIVRGCKLSATMAINMDVFNGVWEANKDDGTMTYSATEPDGYYFQKLAHTSFTIGGKTLYNVENIGAGRYNIWAAGAPPASGFVTGSRWTDVTAGLEYLHDGTAFRKQPTVIEASTTFDFGSVAAQSTANTLVTVTGVAAGDVVSLGVNGTPPNGLIFTAVATATNGVRIYAHNFTASAIDPASFTFSVKVFK